MSNSTNPCNGLFDTLLKATVLPRCGICSLHKVPCPKCLEATKRMNNWTEEDLARERDSERRYSCKPRL